MRRRCSLDGLLKTERAESPLIHQRRYAFRAGRQAALRPHTVQVLGDTGQVGEDAVLPGGGLALGGLSGPVGDLVTGRLPGPLADIAALPGQKAAS